MKHKLSIILIAFNCFCIFGQYKLDRFVHDLNKSDYIFTKDTNQISFSIADSVVRTIGLKSYKQTALKNDYIDERMFFPYSISFSKYKLTFSNTTTFSYNNLNYDFKPKDTVFVYGFTCNYAPSRVGSAARNISRFYMSAYMQQINKDYNQRQSFIKLPTKDLDKFWKRNWISMGYGMSYSLNGNPFASAKGTYVGFAYFWDAFTSFMIVGGPFIGKTTKDKIEIPILGIVINLIYKKYFIGRMGELNVDSYNSIVNSKYGIPNNLEY
jgi:hypothetical protein